MCEDYSHDQMLVPCSYFASHVCEDYSRDQMLVPCSYFASHVCEDYSRDQMLRQLAIGRLVDWWFGVLVEFIEHLYFANFDIIVPGMAAALLWNPVPLAAATAATESIIPPPCSSWPGAAETAEEEAQEEKAEGATAGVP